MYANLKAMRMGATEQDKVIKLMNTRYERTEWGFINDVTEVAQDYTFDIKYQLINLMHVFDGSSRVK